MGWAPLLACHKPRDTYDEERDLLFFQDTPEMWFKVEPNRFAVFFPEDAHLPLIGTGSIHKVIVKVAL